MFPPGPWSLRRGPPFSPEGGGRAGGSVYGCAAGRPRSAANTRHLAPPRHGESRQHLTSTYQLHQALQERNQLLQLVVVPVHEPALDGDPVGELENKEASVDPSQRGRHLAAVGPGFT